MHLLKVMILMLLLSNVTVRAAEVAATPEAPIDDGAANTTQTVYKWVDEEGNTHYGDIPPNADAKPITLPKLPIVKGGMPPTTAKPSTTPIASTYTLSIASPTNGETIRNNQNSVSVTVNVEPALAKEHALILLLDNQPFNFAGGGTYNLTVERGEHSLQAQIVNSQNNVLVASDSIRFTLLTTLATTNKDGTPEKPSLRLIDDNNPDPKHTPAPGHCNSQSKAGCPNNAINPGGWPKTLWPKLPQPPASNTAK